MNPSAEQLRPKTGKTMVAKSVAGHRKFLQKGGRAGQGQKDCSPGFARFAGVKARSAKKPF